MMQEPGEQHRDLEDRVLVVETHMATTNHWMERIEKMLVDHIADSRTLPGYSGNGKSQLVLSKGLIVATTTGGGAVVGGVIQLLRMLEYIP